mmetsp:Transcript_35322/g.75405  ORF Transcript_35322/g.75405 Transcript_35322/m.75405 type:complete len:198 (-) Transcript_35322:120-713(-)
MKELSPKVLAFLVGAMSSAHGGSVYPPISGPVVIDYHNGHWLSSTGNQICFKQHSYRPYPKECSVPHEIQQPNWELAKIHEFRKGESFEITIEDGNGGWGKDAFLIDGLKIQIDGTETLIGANNNIGWCLSGDKDDHELFGSKAYQGKCCPGVKITLDSIRDTTGPQGFSWEWTHCSGDVSSGVKSVARVLKKHIRG